MATSRQPQNQGGFDCEFVEKPQSYLQSECPVCLLILRDPWQATCCGNSFCLNCIDKIIDSDDRCPTCNEDCLDDNTYCDKRLRRALYGFQVHCSHKEKGCEWKGELGQLEEHLNLFPQPDKQLEGCKYSEIECTYCSELIKRPYINTHQNGCPKRPFSCEYCHSYTSNYEDIVNNHWPVCGYQIMQCPNECGKTLLRQSLENHVTRDCPKTVIDCDFHHVGCDVKLPRKDMPAHLNENLVTHMSLQAANYSKLLESHKELQTTLEEKVNKLENENEALRHQLSRPILTYVEFTMNNYEQHKKNDDVWYSPPFYSHPGGYKFCLWVNANGYGIGKGTHVSVFTRLMKGEFDDHLKWPFRGEIFFQLVDQEGEKRHRTDTILYHNETPELYASRVTYGDRNGGWGKHKFISHDKLEPIYLKNDSLCFRITKIKSNS